MASRVRDGSYPIELKQFSMTYNTRGTTSGQLDLFASIISYSSHLNGISAIKRPYWLTNTIKHCKSPRVPGRYARMHGQYEDPPYVWHIAIIARIPSQSREFRRVNIYLILTDPLLLLILNIVIVIVIIDALVFDIGMEWLLFVVLYLHLQSSSSSQTKPWRRANKHLQVGFRTGPASASSIYQPGSRIITLG